MQLDYVRDMAAGAPGLIADSAIVQDIETMYSTEGPIGYGRAVTRGPSEGSIVHPDAEAEVTDEKLFHGIVVSSHEQVATPLLSAVTPAAYSQKNPVPVMRKGRVWVLVEDQVTEGTSVPHVRTGGSGLLGAIRASDDGANAAPMPKAKFKTSTQGPNQLAILEIDL